MRNHGDNGDKGSGLMTGRVDVTAFEKDIEELLDEFELCGSLLFSAFKKVWLSRKFSYVFEGRPAMHNSGVFMQCLYSHCIGTMSKSGTLSRRLGGLYCLYSLHEVQPFKPSFKIYISLAELKRLRQLVLDSKKEGLELVSALVNRMMERQSFLFGSVDAVHSDSLKQRVDEVKKLQNRLLETAYDKLLACSQIEDYLRMNLGQELELNQVKRMSSDYLNAKQLAMAEASKTVKLGEARIIAERGDEVGAKMEELVEEWDAAREEFLRTTGLDQAATVPEDEFGAELEQLLFED
ncbi:small nuclear RNA activating complex (SNAPc), subunit SNAP43 protein isoform X1 [Wolffia australiana]